MLLIECAHCQRGRIAVCRCGRVLPVS